MRSAYDFHLVAFVLGLNQEDWGGGGPILPTPIVDRFSADLLIAIESYWTDSHLEFCQTSTTKLLSENMWSAFR